MGGLVFETQGNQSNMSVTNNIFINCNVQCYSKLSLTSQDGGELDQDFLPIGIINVDTLPGTMPQLERKILVQNNLAYWDYSLHDVDSILNANSVNFVTDWVKQMMTMNSRTQAMFNDNTTFPYLVEGSWATTLPTFTDPKDLLTTQVGILKTFTLGTVDTNSK
jgi:hypothetical protein